MRGRSIPLSLGRRLIVDITAMAAPTVPVQRVMQLAPLVAARAALRDRPAWTAIFTKAYALVADEYPVLRRAYVKLPWPHLYEYPVSTAQLAIEREHQGELIVLPKSVANPAGRPLVELSDEVKAARNVPMEEVREFRRALDVARLPLPLRRLVWWVGLNVGRQRGNYFGTFGVSVYSSLGSESLHPISMLTAVLNYGVIAKDGTVPVRLIYDHRVFDGSTVARVLERLEQRLNGDIVAELRLLPATAPAGHQRSA